MESSFGVHSEVGQLRKVLVCAPGKAHQRLTPSNCDDLLFDDVLWVDVAKRDHFDFMNKLRDRGVHVVEMHNLLEQTVAVPEAKAWILDNQIVPNKVGPDLVNDVIVFSTLDSESITVEPVPEPVLAEGVEVYSAMAGAETFTLVATERICTDPMSGMPFPKTVVVALGGQAFVGCGGDPLGLLVGEWRIELIGGKPVISRSETTLAFDVDGSMHGNAACNRFFGGYALTGEGLTLSPAGATRMACENELMDQEDRFLSALEQVVRFGRTTTGQLQLFGADGSVVLTASP